MRRECVKWIREVGLGLYSAPSWARGFRVGFLGYKAQTAQVTCSLETMVTSRVSGLVHIYITLIYIYIHISKSAHNT